MRLSARVVPGNAELCRLRVSIKLYNKIVSLCYSPLLYFRTTLMWGFTETKESLPLNRAICQTGRVTLCHELGGATYCHVS